MNRLFFLLFAVVTVMLGFAIVNMAIADTPVPNEPAWALPNGQIDVNKLPDCIPIMGANGLPSKDSKGQNRCMPKAELIAPPPSLTISEIAETEMGESVLEGTTSSPIIIEQVIPIRP